MAKHLTKEQRYYIYVQIATGVKQSCIAKALGVSKSTISREIKRNSRDNGIYDAEYAHKKSMQTCSRASSAKAFKKFSKRVVNYIHSKLTDKWSPEQISGRMRIDLGKHISPETIYQYIRHDRKNGGNLFKLLPHKGKKYRYGFGRRSTIIGRVDISERPKIVEHKSRVGDFEIDTVVSARHTGKGCLFTMVDRRSKDFYQKKCG